MIIESTKYNNPVLVEGEVQFLQKVGIWIRQGRDHREIQSLLKERKGGSRSSIYSSLEFDIVAFFELGQTETSSRILRDKFRELSRAKVKELLVSRVSAVNDHIFELPEQMFQIRNFRIRLDNRLIDVKEILRKNWEYVLYKSENYNDEYYVDIVFDGVATYNKMFKLSNAEMEVVRKAKSETEIDDLIKVKREQNWT